MTPEEYLKNGQDTLKRWIDGAFGVNGFLYFYNNNPDTPRIGIYDENRNISVTFGEDKYNAMKLSIKTIFSPADGGGYIEYMKTKVVNMADVSSQNLFEIGSLLERGMSLPLPLSKEERTFKDCKDRWGMNMDGVIGDQLARAGITAYVFIDGEYEGRILPSGIPDTSMDLVASDGRIYNVWLRWNPDKKAPDGSTGYYELDEFNDDHKSVPWKKYPQPVPPMKRGEAEGTAYIKPWYIQSRKLLDLSISDDQEEILRNYLTTHPPGRVVRMKKLPAIVNQAARQD